MNSSVVGQNVPDAAQPVTINFDSLPTNMIVTNEYTQLHFSGTGFSGGVGGPLGNDVWTQSNFGSGGSTPNAIFSTYNPSFTNPNYARGQATLFLDFTVPVNNLSFSLLNVRQTTLYAWVYVNRLFYGYYTLTFNGNGSLVRVNDLAGIQNITGIQINPINWDPVYSYVPLYYDDFTFTPAFDVRMTNARVSGVLNGTNQNALAGADIALNASVIPSQTGGSYSWTFTGPYVVVGGNTNSPSVTIRSTDVGTLTAKVTYTLNGFSAFGTVTINAILPSLLSFTAQSATDRISRDQHCGGVPPAILGAQYSLGCYQTGGPDDGVVFTASAQIPSGQYLTNPAQSGIKIKQFISGSRKRVNDTGNGNIECATVRSSPDQFETGWQLDVSEAMSPFVHPPPTFSQGNTLTYKAFDAPGDGLDTTFLGAFSMMDFFFSDDRFQTYVYYYVGDPLNPIFQRPLRLSSENTFNYSYIGWKWNGQAVFDWSNPLKYRLQFTNTPSLFGTGTNALPVLHGNFANVPYAQCAGDPSPSTHKIDGGKCFVNQQYWDFLNRAPDQTGWDFWLNQITQCGFDRNCIDYMRIQVAKAFFLSGDFIATDPDMANPPGSPNFNPAVYNRAFVKHCYTNFLRRLPDQGGWDFWTNKLNATGDYNEMIKAFILAGEYRDRPFPLFGTQPCPVCFHECA